MKMNLKLTEYQDNDKYYVSTGPLQECDSLDEALLENYQHIIKGSVVRNNYINEFIKKNKLLSGPSQENQESEYDLSPTDLEKIFKASKQTIWRWEKDGLLPKSIHFGRKKFWKSAEIELLAKRRGVKL